ncbi:MAG TPA: hypothetical protein VGG84_07895 [Gemmatimonadaceae bacterium]|jgi:hypothetical protein
MTTTMGTPMAGAFAEPHPRERVRGEGGASDFAWHAYVVVLAAVLVVTGLIWDISWHMSIGRDTFWTPAHLMLQAGGLLAGLASGALAAYVTFRGTPEERSSAVWFWGFRAPFGAWVCVWGCGAMLTSAPFDDWWHNAYGLDVRIVSPPHVLLLIGMMSIVLGALLRSLALQNGGGARAARAAVLFDVSAGLLLALLGILMLEWSNRNAMHSGDFYRAMAKGFPLLLAAVAVAGRSRWPATTAAAVYTLLMAVTSWILMLFPATPKLGPIYQPITHYVPLEFPLLLIVPAFVMDLTWRRARAWPWWKAAVAMGAAFLVPFALVQWPFASFLMTHGRNWFFHTDNFVYWQPPQYEKWHFIWRTPPAGDPPLAVHLLLALAYASLASAVGMAWGGWMSKVRR